jgi:uncharacterized phage-associated protein
MKISIPAKRSCFNERKATQAAAKFLDLAGGSMNYMLLIKLLYLLDRRALKKWGRAVTGDEYYSMKLGPVLSEVLTLITQQPDPDTKGYWATHISEPNRYVVEISENPGDDELSEAEESVIQAVFEKYGSYDPFQLADHLHQVLSEWQPVEHGRIPITIADILKAHGKSEEQIAAVESDVTAVAKVQRLFAVKP